MALDTRDRRASAVLVGLPWRGLLPLPDVAAEDQGDRQHVGGYYRGVLAAASIVSDQQYTEAIWTGVQLRPATIRGLTMRAATFGTVTIRGV